MALTQVAREITAPYSAIESWVYDRVIAPAVVSMHEALDRELAELPRGARVLDVGCGGGHALVRLAETRPDLELVGVDLSVEQVRRARERTAKHGRRVTVVQGSALDLPFRDAEFDGVVSIASIKHWPDAARGVRECVRVLKPGGRLVIVEADRGCKLEDVRAFTSRWRAPRAMRRLAVPLFRTYVAGQAIDLEDARALLASVTVAHAEAKRIEGTPAVVMLARK